jgi:hypothetical protein
MTNELSQAAVASLRPPPGQLAADCALPGGYKSGGYATGWARILARLAAAAEAQTR